MNLAERSRILARGRDRVRLLHNLTSNDIKKLAPGQGCYAFLLNSQGRIQADLHLFCFADHFLLDTEPDLREKVPQWIRRYIIADQVELEDVTARTTAIGLEGPAVVNALTSVGAPIPAANHAHLLWGEYTVAWVSLTGQPGFRFFCAAEQRESLIRQLESAGAKSASAEDARIVRIENGEPRYGEDILDTTLPQETQQMNAINFTKGCYLGQEIVERIRARGHVNRKLVRLEIDGAEPLAAGTKLASNGSEAGEITSSVYSQRLGRVAGLGYVRVEHSEPGSRLEADGRAVEVLSLP